MERKKTDWIGNERRIDKMKEIKHEYKERITKKKQQNKKENEMERKRRKRKKKK